MPSFGTDEGTRPSPPRAGRSTAGRIAGLRFLTGNPADPSLPPGQRRVDGFPRSGYTSTIPRRRSPRPRRSRSRGR